MHSHHSMISSSKSESASQSNRISWVQTALTAKLIFSMDVLTTYRNGDNFANRASISLQHGVERDARTRISPNPYDLALPPPRLRILMLRQGLVGEDDHLRIRASPGEEMKRAGP